MANVIISQVGRRCVVLSFVILAFASAAAAKEPSPYSNQRAWLRTVPEKYQSRAEFAFLNADPALPNVLLIGDSISMSYTEGVRERLAGVANVYRAPNNCRSTRQSLAEFKTYLGEIQWEVIHFNWGIHDVTHLDASGKTAPPPQGKLQVPLDEYRDNFRQLLQRLQKTGAKLIWASTTPIGRNTESRGFRRDSDVVVYNNTAAESLKRKRIATNDLCSLVKPHAEEWMSDGVHFRPQGRMVLADAVAKAIRHELAGGRKDGSNLRNNFVRKLLGVSKEQPGKLEFGENSGLLELAPVNLPTYPKGDNDHFGWPVATAVEDSLIVVHRAMPGHNRKLSGDADEHTTYSMIVRSNDGGRTWSKPYDVRDCVSAADRNRGGFVPLSHRFKFDPDNHSPLGYKLHLNSIGTTRTGAVVLASDHGVFRSEDKGKTWKHLREAFREDGHEGPFVSVGPRIIDHPQHGLLLFAHHSIYKNRRPHDIARELAVYRSHDGGESWERTQLALPNWCKPAEPDVIFHDRRFVAIVRNQAPTNILAQMRFQFGDKEIGDVANTNMKTQRSVDTSALCFNPITQRYEVVQSKREDMSINLFSLAPEDWGTAKWRFEGQLFQRDGRFYRTADGFHTGGAVIDEARGVQHVFFYSGHPGGPAGVFRLTRTLHTPKLAKFLKLRTSSSRKKTVHWIGKAKSAAWNEPSNWDLDVPGKHDVVIFEKAGAGQVIRIDDVAEIGRLELRFLNKTDRLRLTGSGKLVIHGAETGIQNKFSAAFIRTGILDFGRQLRVEIRGQRFIAGNQDGTVVIRSNQVRAVEKSPSNNRYPSDGENLKIAVTDRGRFELRTPHWEPGMSLDMSAGHTQGAKVFDFALQNGSQGVSFVRLKEHDGDPIEIYGFDDDDFFRFRANPFTSCDKGKEFRIEAVKFVGWPDDGKASVERRGEFWYLKPAAAGVPDAN